MNHKIRDTIILVVVFVFLMGLVNPIFSYAASPYFLGEGTEISPYQISTSDDLAKLASLVNEGNTDYSWKYYQMQNDIDLSGIENWTPIGVYDFFSFLGTFDGNGYHINGLSINKIGSSTETIYMGLFGTLQGTVKNLGVVNSSIKGSDFMYLYVGGIVGYVKSGGKVLNCFNESNILSISSHSYVGGLVGLNTGAISNSYNLGNIYSKNLISVSSSGGVGGVAGESYGPIEKCYNSGKISDDSFDCNYSAGGIVGKFFSGDTKNHIIDSYNIGNITSGNAGGIVGIARKSHVLGTLEISNCSNAGTLTSIYSAGGIVADVSEGVNISNCYNKGIITDGLWAGGIIGSSNNTAILNCYNIGSIAAKGSIGGIVGQSDRSRIENCYNTGILTVLPYEFDSYLGGIIGSISRYNYGYVNNSYYSNSIIRQIGNDSRSIYPNTLEELQQQSTFYGFDFDNIWTMPQNIAYTPVLRATYLPLESIVLNNTSMVTNEKRYLLSSIPLNATITDCIWTSTNTDIASVNSFGEVNGVAPGQCHIIATSKQGGFIDSCVLTVYQGVQSIDMLSSLIINVGDITQLNSLVQPENSYNSTLSWSSSDESVACINQYGEISGLVPGTSIITATSTDGSGIYAKCSVTVNRLVTGIELIEPPTSILVGNIVQLKLNVSPTDASNQSIEWTSSNNSIASIDSNGLLSGISKGKVTITAKSVDGGYIDSCEISVQQPVTGITLNTNQAEVAVDKQINLITTVLPNDADNKSVTWLSSNPAIATVSINGLVTGISSGETLITAQTVNGGFLAYCIVLVGTGIDQINITGEKSVHVNQSILMNATILPESAISRTVEWNVISGTGSAEISESGLLTGIREGTVTIQAFSTDGTEIIASYEVNVINYMISYVSNGGSAVVPSSATAGSFVAEPEEPTRADMFFGGWYKDEALTIPWDFATDRMTAEDVVLYAMWMKDYSGIYNIRSVNSDLVMDVYDVGTTEGTNIIQWGYHGRENQQWRFESLGNGYYKITSALNPTYSLDVYDAGTSEGNRVIQWTYHGGKNQQWKVMENADGSVTLMSRLAAESGTRYVLDVFGGGKEPGVNVIQWSGNGGDNQKWQLEPVKTYAVSYDSNGGSAVTSSSVRTDALAAEPQAPSKEGMIFSGWYRNQALTNPWDFARDRMPAEEMTLYAKWQADVSGTYVIRSVNSDLVMDVYDGGTTEGTNIIQWGYHGRENQQWRFETLGNGYYKITSVLNPTYSLDVYDAGTSEGNRVIQWTYHGGTNQQWKVTENSDGSYTLMSRLAVESGTGYVLDVFGGGKEPGVNVIQWSGNGGDNQKWQLEAVEQ